MNHLTTYTLITGASGGLGKQFALECARQGMNMILFALPGSNIRFVAADLEAEYHIDVRVFEFDLTNHMQVIGFAQYVMENYPVNFLINNAGIGGTSPITRTSVEMIDQIVLVNVRSMVLLTRMLIPHLQQHEKSYILNVSSIAAFTPIAYKTVYPASKAFISSFSHGLREELQGTGLHVSVLYPGPIMTNSNTTRRILSQGQKGKMGLLSTAEIARMAIRKTFKRRPVIIPGIMNRISLLLMWLLPLKVKLRIVSREVKKEMQFAMRA